MVQTVRAVSSEARSRPRGDGAAYHGDFSTQALRLRETRKMARLPLVCPEFLPRTVAGFMR